MSNIAQSYRAPARLLHWLVALLVLATIPAGLVMTQEGLPRATQDLLYLFHKNVGVLILLLMLLRLLYRFRHPPPPLPATMPRWQQRIAQLSHAMLYLLLFVMAISGYIRVKAGGYPIEYLDALGLPSLVRESDTIADTARAIHQQAKFLLMAFIGLHVGAALHHLLIKRDEVFWRMWPGRRPNLEKS